VKLLLDTCSLIWMVQEPARLSTPARRALADPANAVFASSISFWEISLKHALGKLSIRGAVPGDFPGFAFEHRCELLPLAPDVAATFGQLPVLQGHRDPFDRMLVWQAIRADLVLVSRDRAMSGYAPHGLQICW